MVQHVHHVVQAVAFDQRVVRRLLPLVHHHVAERPAGLGLVGLRRGVVDLDRLLDDRQLLLRQAEDAGDFFRRRRAAELFGQPRAWPAATCESSSTMYAGMRIVLPVLMRARLIDCLIQ